MPRSFVRVASTDELADGEMMAVEADGEEVLLARVGGQFYAIGNVCTHAAAWLDQGQLIPAKLEVECPLHSGRFSLTSGEATQVPAMDPVDAYAVRIEGTDVLIGPPQE
jgi:nitrite reductase/ring-hydroxylating ferredoxin subunit